MSRINAYQLGLIGSSPIFVARSSLSFIERSANVYPDHPDHLTAIYGEWRQTWGQTYTRCHQLARARQPVALAKAIRRR